MANQITGRIIEIGQTVQIPSKSGGSPFTKREFSLDATTYDPYTGERSEYENIIPLEFSGDKCAELDRFRNWSASVAGIYLPAANEHQMLLYAQQEIQRNQEFI